MIEEQLLAFYKPLLKPERTIINQTSRNERCFSMVKDHIKELSRITASRIILMEGFIEKTEYRYINQVIDWFFNRILLGVDMNVPLNFLHLNQWEFLLKQVGFKITKIEYVGADEKLAPEHHVLIIADRE